MAIEATKTGSGVELQAFADRMDAHGEELTGFRAALAGAQSSYASSVKGNGVATATDLAFENAMNKTNQLRGLVLQAEEAMNNAGVQTNNADDEAKAAVHAAAYAF